MVTAPSSGAGEGQSDYVEIQAEAIAIDHNRRNLNNSTFVIPQLEK